MSIYVIGINHKTASIALRERAYFASDKLALYLQDLLNRGLAQEAVLLSTCNRSELYCDAPSLEALKDWFCRQTSLTHLEADSALYVYKDKEAIAHMMRVACGLDSMILGEPQILGQMKAAFSESCTAGAIEASFHRLFQQIFTVAKEIRTSTAIGACPVSVASAAFHFAKKHFPDFTHANVLLIGAGETNEIIVRYLRSHLTKPISLVNRCTEKAARLASGGRVYSLDELQRALSHADIVFSATGSATPIVQRGLMSKIMQNRGTPMMIIDVAVPRDIEPAVGELSRVMLYCIDDLKAIIEQNRQGREHAAVKARELIRERSVELLQQHQSVDRVAHTIRAYRNRIEEMCHNELIKAKQQLNKGEAPTMVLDAFAHAFTKKLLHAPSVQLRQAGAHGQTELLRLAKQLFAIPDNDDNELERI